MLQQLLMKTKLLAQVTMKIFQLKKSKTINITVFIISFICFRLEKLAKILPQATDKLGAVIDDYLSVLPDRYKFKYIFFIFVP